MKRKNWSIFFIGMLAMCTIAGCSDNELNAAMNRAYTRDIPKMPYT